MSKIHTVDCQRRFDHSAERVWQIVSDFYSSWHPLIQQCAQEGSAPIRRFTMPGSDQVYREQLIYRSDSQRRFRYHMLAGIAGIERYRGEVSIEHSGDGCLLRWRADITGDEVLVAQVAKGTAAVFEAGFDALERFYPATVKCGNLALGHHPSLNNPDWLCLFLHGIGGNRTNWDAQLSAIAGIMPCAALDLRGYGDSKPGSEPTTVEDYCADIRAIVEHFNTKHLVLAGLSYGAWIATHFALNYPEELAGLALCGGCTGMSEAAESVRQGFLHARLEPMDAGQTPADFAQNVVAIISGPEATAAQQEAMKQSMAAIPPATYRDALQCFTHPPGRFDFGQLACPALLMTGEYDKLAAPAEIAEVAQRMVDTNKDTGLGLPDIQFEVISQAGHMANLEQPVVYNQLLSNFLRRISRQVALQQMPI